MPKVFLTVKLFQMKSQLHFFQTPPRKYYLHFFVIIMINLIACNKTTVDSPQVTTPHYNPTTVKVLEKLTNIPIQGASVTIIKCSGYDAVLGCTGSVESTVLHTNNQGEVTFNVPDNLKALKISHEKYWTTVESLAGSIKLTPMCTLKINVKRVNTNSQNDTAQLGVNDAECFRPECAFGRYTFVLPGDTTIYAPGFGNSSTHLMWSSTTTMILDTSVSVNKFDTASLNVIF